MSQLSGFTPKTLKLYNAGMPPDNSEPATNQPVSSEHHYWRDQIDTGSYLDVSRQIEELLPAS